MRANSERKHPGGTEGVILMGSQGVKQLLETNIHTVTSQTVKVNGIFGRNSDYELQLAQECKVQGALCHV